MDEYRDTALYNPTEETLRWRNIRKGLSDLQFLKYFDREQLPPFRK